MKLKKIKYCFLRCKAWEFEQRPDISPELEEKLRAFSKKHVLLKAAAQVFTGAAVERRLKGKKTLVIFVSI